MKAGKSCKEYSQSVEEEGKEAISKVEDDFTNSSATCFYFTENILTPNKVWKKENLRYLWEFFRILKSNQTQLSLHLLNTEEIPSRFDSISGEEREEEQKTIS